MTMDRTMGSAAFARMTGVAVMIAGVLALSQGEASAEPVLRHRGAQVHPVRTAAMRPLTVHRRAVRGPALAGGGYYGYEAPGIVRRWNDPNLDSFGGWRLGGDNFYGDGRGDTITRGNATLGQISGYGAARGGYGGPHFDSVGGFHNGPGPDAQEDDDYASGSISRPDYGGIVPHYASVKQRVAALNTGVPYAIAPTRAAYRAETDPARPADDGDRYARPDDIFPDLGLGDDGSF